MAKQEGVRPGRREKARWQGYVNFLPSEGDQRGIKKDLLTWEKIEDFIETAVNEGYKVSVKYDDYRSAPVVEVFGFYADCVNAGQTLVIAHSDLRVAMSGAAYFCRKIAENGVWPSQVDLDNPYDW